MKTLLAVVTLFGLLLVLPANATVITGVSGSNLGMPILEYFGPGPQAFGNYTWSSTNATFQGGSVFGYTQGYGFGANGYWDGALGPMAGVNDSFLFYGVTDTMTFAFTDPVFWVGGFFNYYPGGGTPTTLAVWDADHNLIESYDLTFLTGGGANTGEWIRFEENTPIAYFTMTGNYVGVSARGPVPEPSSLLLLGTGLIGAAGALRRKIFR